MSETKWTPGPWKAERISEKEIEIGAETPDGHMSVAWLHLGNEPTTAECAAALADANLIAAAPDMADAILKTLVALDYDKKPREERSALWVVGQRKIAEKALRAALAKARGER